MTINYIPNDPKSTQPGMRVETKAPDRPQGAVRFVTGAMPTEARHPKDTPEFVAWQCRQAAFNTLNVFEDVAGPLTGWRGESSVTDLAVIADSITPDLNAYYDRASISFFHGQAGTKTVYSGASTDVVAHEAGHAILDALRPDLWDAQMIEPAAFHEGFGDCIAVMMALSDRETREKLLANGASIDRANFVEATAEQLSWAIGVNYPGHNASKPRRAYNRHKWVLPETLPDDGGPNVLINESHSLGQLVSGVYYDLISKIYAAGTATGQAALWTACRTATMLIVQAAIHAPIRPRFFESWGRSMAVIDQTDFSGANSAHIKAAFLKHGMVVGVTGYLTPQMTVPGTALKGTEGASMLSPAAKRNLRGVLGVAPGTPLSLRRVDLGGQNVAEAVARQAVDLTGISERLSGVVSHVPRPALVGEVGRGLALLGSVQQDMVYTNEVRNFVARLVKKSAIDFGDGSTAPNSRSAAAARATASSSFAGLENRATHAVIARAGQQVLTRKAFACGCGHRHGRRK